MDVLKHELRLSLFSVIKWYERDKCRDFVVQRLPILNWLPQYKLTWLLQDALAGFTVGLTAVPQGIAYGIVAGLSPEVCRENDAVLVLIKANRHIYVTTVCSTLN